MEEFDKKAFGARLQKRIKELGLSQEGLGKMTGLDKNTIGNYVTGNSVPGADKVVLICDALKCGETWLLRGEPEDGESTVDVGLSTAMRLLRQVYSGGGLDRIIAIEYLFKAFAEIDRLREEVLGASEKLHRLLSRYEAIKAELDEIKKRPRRLTINEWEPLPAIASTFASE